MIRVAFRMFPLFRDFRYDSLRARMYARAKTLIRKLTAQAEHAEQGAVL